MILVYDVAKTGITEDTYEILNISIDIFLHAASSCGNPASKWTELYGVWLMTSAVALLC